MTDRVQELTDKYKNLIDQPVESTVMEFVPTKEPFPLFGHLLAYHTAEVNNLMQSALVSKMVEFIIVTKNSNGDRCTQGGGQVTVQLRSFTGDVTVGEIRDNGNGSYTASFVAEHVGEAKLLVSINGEKTQGSPYTIVVGRNYQAIDEPSTIVSRMGQPQGIAFDRNGLWAVADWSNHCVYIFNDEDQFVRKFGSYGSNNGQFCHPRGIAFDNHDHLYVVDTDNHRIEKFDTGGNYLLQFGGKGACDGQLTKPFGVTVHNEKVYIAEHNNNRISVFQTNGRFCTTFGSDQLSNPRDVTVGVDNHLLVTDSGNNCIVIYTPDGHYVRKFGTPGSGRGQLNKPFSLTTDSNGFIIVTDTYNYRVSIFDKYGNFIHSFGSRGSANGKFNSAVGIALSPNGGIYVSDTDNKRIQIFSNY